MKPIKNKPQEELFPFVEMGKLIPESHILRLIDRFVDFSFIDDLVDHAYSETTGRPAIDPELLVRILMKLNPHGNETPIILIYIANVSKKSKMSGPETLLVTSLEPPNTNYRKSYENARNTSSLRQNSGTVLIARDVGASNQ